MSYANKKFITGVIFSVLGLLGWFSIADDFYALVGLDTVTPARLLFSFAVGVLIGSLSQILSSAWWDRKRKFPNNLT